MQNKARKTKALPLWTRSRHDNFDLEPRAESAPSAALKCSAAKSPQIHLHLIKISHSAHSYDCMKEISSFLCLSLVIIVISSMSGCRVAESGDHWKSIPMRDGKLEVRYEAPFGFGTHTLYFYFKRKGDIQFLRTVELHNDGAALGDSNISVDDLGGGKWMLTLKGQEQDDELWLVEVNDKGVKMTESR